MADEEYKHGPTIKELLSEAKDLEAEDPDGALAVYQKILKRDKHLAVAYDRMMIVFRKQKQPRKEIAVIDKAIKIFGQLHQPRVSGASKAQVTKISNSLSRSLGLVDKKGVPFYDSEPVAKWKRRRALLEKRMSK